MTDETPDLPAERIERRQKIKELTAESKRLYAELGKVGDERAALIVDEMNDGAVARELAELTGLSVGRIYRLRDNGMEPKE